ncbi:lipocalin-like domain-containing protein [Gelidibacter pelagius]|uniref:Lipocalin family protein n=1 Tax=Gelidibacter pelagius TaxID=2819985 RepID=A0ABS3SQ32_9FLAO|nr:lipocalin family protein [Gelidibacter pelagius]MBO3097814.1 lipocalin family protein [Gelidibacter pelagius]
MNLRALVLLFLGFTMFFSCSNDDDMDSASDFYAGAKTSASSNQLVGTWAIYNVGFNGQTSEVPVNYDNCGRDFLVFTEDGKYTEYLFQSSHCDYDANSLKWTLNNGVITLSNPFNQSDVLVITQVSANELTFKARLDVDEDGKLDIVTLHLKRYTPTKFDMVSGSFARNTTEAARNLISFIWQPYYDASSFVAYEIYRSVGQNCAKENAVLISTITDVDATEFTDLNPPGEERLCYYLKTKIRSGTLGESYLHSLDTYTLEAKPVNLSEPVVANNTILLKWEKSDMPYFSHYEISYSNFPSGITGHGKQVVKIAHISDRDVTTFIDENPPYLKNPTYGIRVFDIFGNETFNNPQGYKTTYEVNYERDGLLPIHRLSSYATDSIEPIVYLYGHETEDTHKLRILRYNYETNITEAISSREINTSTYLPIELFSSDNGKELFLEQAGELQIYDAATLEYKYSLNPTASRRVNDFRLSKTGYWILTDTDHLYSYLRDGNNLSLVDSKPHFSNHQSEYNYSVFEIENNQIIVGHKNESKSMVYSIDNNGLLSYLKTVAMPIKDYGVNQAQYNASGQYIVNFEDNSWYSTLDFSSMGTIQQPHFISGLSRNGDHIYGTNNDPSWGINDMSAHTKEAVVYNRRTQQIQTLSTIGYPLLIFQNHKGEVISISSGLKKSHLHESFRYTKDLFVEKLYVQ